MQLHCLESWCIPVLFQVTRSRKECLVLPLVSRANFGIQIFSLNFLDFSKMKDKLK